MKDAREAAGLTQGEVAQELADAGVLPTARYQTVSEWELEKRDPTPRELTWLRDRYGVDIDWLVAGVEAEKEAAAFRRMAAIVDEIRAGEDAKVVGSTMPPGPGSTLERPA